MDSFTDSVAQKVMQEIRESLPSIKNALKELRDNPSNLKLCKFFQIPIS